MTSLPVSDVNLLFRVPSVSPLGQGHCLIATKLDTDQEWDLKEDIEVPEVMAQNRKWSLWDTKAKRIDPSEKICVRGFFLM